MVAVRPLVGVFVEQDVALQHDLGLRRHHQRHGFRRNQLGLGAAQETGELVFRQGVRHGGDGGQDQAGIGAQDRAGRQGLRLAGGLPAAMMLGAAAMGQPAHDRPVLANDLHPIDAEVEIVLAAVGRPLGHHQGPGDQGRRLAGPAGLDWQLVQVDVVAPEHDLLHRRFFHRFGAHAHDGLGQGQHVPGVLQAARRLGLAQEGQKFAHFAQFAGRGAFHPVQGHTHGHPLDRAEQVGQAGDGRGLAIGPHGVFEQDGGTALGQQAGADLGHFQDGGDGLGDPHQFTRRLQLGDEFPQGPIGHMTLRFPAADARAFRRGGKCRSLAPCCSKSTPKTLPPGSPR